MQHRVNMGYWYTQIMGLTGLAHGQIYIESETHSYGNFHHAVLKQLNIHEELKEIATRWQYLGLLSNLVMTHV